MLAPVLFAAGEEDTARLRQALEAARFLAITAGVEVHHVDARLALGDPARTHGGFLSRPARP